MRNNSLPNPNPGTLHGKMERNSYIFCAIRWLVTFCDYDWGCFLVTTFSVLSLCADFIYKLEKLCNEVKKNDRNPVSDICSGCFLPVSDIFSDFRYI